MKQRSVKIILINGYKYFGEYLDEDADFLIIYDYVIQKKVSIAKSQILITEEEMEG